jgi:HK97 family phage major capsid protein
MPATKPVSKATAKQLREQRADLIQKAQQHVAEKQDDQGLLGAEDQAIVEKMLADADARNQQAKLIERVETDFESLGDRVGAELEPGFNDQGGLQDDGARRGRRGARDGIVMVREGFDGRGRPQYVERPASDCGQAAYDKAFRSALRVTNGFNAQQFAALQSDKADAAGYLLASEQFTSEILKEVDDEVWIRRFADVITVPEADSLGIKKRTAKLNTHAWGPELVEPTVDTAQKYGKKALTPHYLTGAARVSKDLIRRSAGLAEAEVKSEIARDAGEKMESAYLLGTGAQQPLGVFVASTDGISTARDSLTGSATNFTYAGLVAAKYKLKAAYRRSNGSRSGARWMFHRDGISLVAQMLDLNGQPMLRPGRGLLGEDPDELLGYPVDESEFCPNTFTTGLYVGILAQWRYYRIADALDAEISVLTELYAATNENGYLDRLKTDGLPVLEEAFVRLKTS